MDLTIFQNTLFVGVLTFLGGILATVIAQRILNKRSLLTYFVNHVRVGISADDQIFGSVKVTWNETDVQNLYLSTVELTNQSVTDFENIEIRAFSNDTALLTERTEILDTTRTLEWTREFGETLRVQSGQSPTQEQIDLVRRQRRYLIPIFNRGQTVRLTFLNSATSQNSPSIWLDVLHKGIRLKFRVPQNRIYGVEQPKAALAGAVAGSMIIIAALIFIQTNWIIAVVSFVLGLFAQLPGALLIKAWRWIRDVFAS